MKHTPWLWPDRKIGKAESATLRQQQNDLVNDFALLLEALETLRGAEAYAATEGIALDDHMPHSERYALITDAIAKATGKE